MTTWATSTPIRHPWFSQPTMKRKHSASSSPTSSPSPSSSLSSASPPPPTKRRKYGALESGFAHLTLNNPNPYLVTSTSPMFPQVSELASPTNDLPLAMDDSTEVWSSQQVVVFPDSVEEPSIPEVKMKTSSWYEPEPDRIVVTDLDSSSDEEDDEGTDPDKATLSISSAFLKKLSPRSTLSRIPPATPSQALVLFRPLPYKGATNQEESSDKQKAITTGDVVEGVRNDDDDDMDVEPW